MQDVDDSSVLAEAICDAIAKHTGLDSVRDARAVVVAQLAPLVAAALAGRRAAALSHELRNPLAVIATSASLLAPRVGDDERGRKHIARIDAQVKLASSLAHELLDAASPRPIQLELVALHSLVIDCVDSANLPPTITVNVRDDDAPASVARLDRRRTQQILGNLLSNARAACGDHAELALAITRDGPHLIVTVQDNGPGIAREDFDRVFALGVSKSAAGHGFGLAISREWARAQGGDLALRPSDVGACFALRVAAAEGA
jgi:signal transduction histidine kinase